MVILAAHAHLAFNVSTSSTQVTIITIITSESTGDSATASLTTAYWQYSRVYDPSTYFRMKVVDGSQNTSGSWTTKASCY
jgi:hypothetical protein